jgi:hypothetical protein
MRDVLFETRKTENNLPVPNAGRLFLGILTEIQYRIRTGFSFGPNPTEPICAAKPHQSISSEPSSEKTKESLAI